MAARLRGENGCPWDQKQTVESMAKNIVDEAREVEEAIQEGDYEHISEEMGDLLFNLIMIAQIASEDGKFDMATVMGKIAEKIVARHTWVFGTDTAKTPEEAVELWMKNKAKEK